MKKKLIIVGLGLLCIIFNLQGQENDINDYHNFSDNESLTNTLGIKNISEDGVYYNSNISKSLFEPSDHNYIYTRNYQSAQKTAPDFFTPDVSLLQQIMYFDGLGRPIQQVGLDQSFRNGSWGDLIKHITYDGFGRPTREYMPYASSNGGMGTYRPNAQSATNTFYNTQKYENTANPFSEKAFDGSPLNRVTKQAAPGNDWAMGNGHEIVVTYDTNIGGEVRLFYIEYDVNSYNQHLIPKPLLKENRYYTAGTLYKITTTDENNNGGNNHSTQEFKNKQGQVILKRTFADSGNAVAVRHDTYYVYDDFGNLICVLPPKMEATTATITQIKSAIDALGYRYVYDHRNRLVEKQLPGKDKEYILYNNLDQPILTQDQLQRTKNEWLFTKYDAFGRVAYTGKVVQPGTPEAVNLLINAQTTPWVQQKETSSIFGGTTIFYNNDAYPTQNIEIYTINYYDAYVGLPANAPKNIRLFGSNTNEPQSTATQGLPTSSSTKVLDTDAWIHALSYYDKKGRVVYSYTENEYLVSTDVMEAQLDFTGKPLKTKTTHTRNAKTISTLDTYTYDATGRLLSQTQCIGDASMGDNCSDNTSTIVENLEVKNNQNSLISAPRSITIKNALLKAGTHVKISPNSANKNEELIFYNSYDNLGQLQEKKVGGSIGTNYETSKALQTISYDYNVRGWLKGINKDSSEADLFHFGLYYNTALNGSTPLYNGNIAATQWQTENEDKALKSYHYSYDALNRITKATDNTNKYSVSNIAYDKNGNITTLQRAGRVAEFPNLANNTGFGVMDDLSYSYESNTNKLAKVTDNAALDHYGFKDDAVNQAADYSADYAYDANGNMTSDTNKGITKITYNHLNLPKEITIANGADTGTITYTYDAVGTKLDKKVSKNNSTSTTAYAGNYIYENNKLQFFNTPEGYAKPKSTANYAQGFTYVYQYKDHLGNVRLSYADTDKNYENVVRNSFTEDYKGWTNNGSVQLSIDTGRLKVVVDNEYEGVKNFMNGFTTTAGETLKINLTIDTGTTQSALRLYLQELDPNGNLVNYNLLNGNLTTGKHQYQHTTLTTGNRLVLRIDKANTNKTASTYFYIDQIALSRGALEIVEERNYYPFGLEHKGYNNVVNGTENSYFTYQGKENQEELGLNWHDFGARNYDASLGRWMNIDPMAEQMRRHSPYNFAFNNPIYFIDPDGMVPLDWFENQEGKVVWFNNNSENFASENGDEWQNIGANLEEAKESLNLPKNQNLEWNDLEFATLGGAQGNGKGALAPVLLESSAQVSFDLIVENAGDSGLKHIDGETEVTGVNVNISMTTETVSPIKLTGLGGSFGVNKWTPSGKININDSGSFQHTPMLSNYKSHVSGKASLSLGLSSFRNMSRNLGNGGSFDIGVKSTATFKLEQNGRKGFFSTSNTIKIK